MACAIRRGLALLALAAALFFPVSAASAAPARAPASDTEIAGFIGAFLQREIAAREIPGGAVVVMRDGRPILSRGFGVRDYDSRRPIDPGRDLIPTGSTSKLATWILVMQLVEEGRLDLDRDVNAYLDFRLPTSPGRPVTMRHLMTHSAGFGDRIPLVSRETRGATLAVKVRKNRPPLVYPPGEAAAYSNYGAALAGRIVERLRGRPYETLVEQRILAPLGMRQSSLRQPLPAHLYSHVVSTYGALARRPSPPEAALFVGLAPAGSITATAEDMGLLLGLLMGAPSPVLSDGSRKAMLRLERPLVPGLESGFGLGTVGGCYRGVCYFGHGGVTPALATDLEVLPEQGLGWYVAFNGRGRDGSAVPLRHELLRAVIDRFYARGEPVRARADLSTAADVAGRWLAARRMQDGPMRILDLAPMVLRAGPAGALEAELDSGPARFLPVARDRFVEARSGLPLVVARDPQGRAARLASPAFNIASDYERAPGWQRLALPGLMAAPLVLLLAAATAAARGARRWLQRSPRGASQPTIFGGWARAGAAMATLLLAGWSAYLVMAIVEPRFGEPGSPWFGALGLASWLLLPAGVLALRDAWSRRAVGAGWWARALAWALGPALLALFATLAGLGFVAGFG